MKFNDDRLQQFARVSGAQFAPNVHDTQLLVPPVLQPVVEVSQPIIRGGSSAAATFGSVADPVRDSILFGDAVDLSGVQGLDSRTLAVFSPGIWHVNINKSFNFTGTLNLVKFQVLQLVTIVDPLGPIVFTAQLMKHHYTTDSVVRQVVRELWFHFLVPWSLVSITQPTVALDELHSLTSVLARRFF